MLHRVAPLIATAMFLASQAASAQQPDIYGVPNSAATLASEPVMEPLEGLSGDNGASAHASPVGLACCRVSPPDKFWPHHAFMPRPQPTTDTRGKCYRCQGSQVPASPQTTPWETMCCACPSTTCPDQEFLIPETCTCAPPSFDVCTKYPVVLVSSIWDALHVCKNTTLENGGYFSGIWGLLKEAFGSCPGQLHVVGEGMPDMFYPSSLIPMADNAEILKNQLLSIMAVTGKAKVNLIAHSSGGFFARYAITNLGMAPKVASLTTISTPHRGSPVFTHLYEALTSSRGQPASGTALDALLQAITKCNVNQTDLLQFVMEHTESYAQEVFNRNTPNVAGLYYQSYASAINLTSDNVAVAQRLGKNSPLLVELAITELHMPPADASMGDGVSTVDSQKWGTYRGVVPSYPNANFTGLDPFQAINMQGSGADFFPVLQFYNYLIVDLKSKGY